MVRFGGWGPVVVGFVKHIDDSGVVSAFGWVARSDRVVVFVAGVSHWAFGRERRVQSGECNGTDREIVTDEALAIRTLKIINYRQPIQEVGKCGSRLFPVS